MSEFISREKAEERLHHMAEVANSAYDGLSNSQIVMLAQNVIHMMPAADVRPIVTGRWERVRLDAIGVCSNIVCSECNFEPWYNSTEPLYNFCPNCGARMIPPEMEAADDST